MKKKDTIKIVKAIVTILKYVITALLSYLEGSNGFVSSFLNAL